MGGDEPHDSSPSVTWSLAADQRCVIGMISVAVRSSWVGLSHSAPAASPNSVQSTHVCINWQIHTAVPVGWQRVDAAATPQCGFMAGLPGC